jgi:hypothetical protein
MSAAWDWASAKWWKFDFHNHTPASDDYGKGPDQAQHKQISLRIGCSTTCGKASIVSR